MEVHSLLVLCPNAVGERMGGPAIRSAEIARAFAGDALDVTLAARAIEGRAPAGVRCTTWPADGVRELRALLAGADAVLTPPAAPHVMRELRRSGARIVVDLYDPVALEVLERTRSASRGLRGLHATTAADQLADALRSGDFFVCASERQRDLWIGALLALGLVTPARYERDAGLHALIDVVPFGVPAAAPAAVAGDPIRARFPEIAADDRILLWNGGLWPWLDAPTAIAAVARARARGLALRLVFMGASAEAGESAAFAQARRAVEQERFGDAVLFNDSWVPYGERGGWLQAADAVISTHRDHLETRYAFRTRLLDCFWAGVPAVVTDGDELAARIAADDLGAVAAPGDIDGLADAIEHVLRRGRAAYEPALRAAARDYEWPRIVAPLATFLADDTGAVDHPSGVVGGLTSAATRPLRRGAQRLTRLARVARCG